MSTNDMQPAPQQPAEHEPLWTADQVAAYLRVSRSLVYAKAASGELPSIVRFSRRRFHPPTIREFALKGSSGPVVFHLNKRGQ